MQPDAGSLEVFLECSFFPQKHPQRSGKSAATLRTQYRSAVRRLSTSLGRPAVVEDLSVASLDALESELAAEGVRPATRIRIRKRLRTIWRQAANHGLVAAPPPERRSRKKKKPRPRTLPSGRLSADVDLEAYLESRVIPLSSRLRSRASIEDYRSNVRTFETWWRTSADGESRAGRPALSDLTDESIAAAMKWMLDEGRCAATANKLRRVCCRIWRFAYRRGERNDLPRIEKYPEPKRERRTWSANEFQTLLDAAGRQPGSLIITKYIDPSTRAKMIPASTWWTALILTLGVTGARISAVMAIRWRQVDFARCTITLLAEHQKQRADQAFAMTPQLSQVLKNLRDDARDVELVFPWPFDGGNNKDKYYPWARLTKEYRMILKRAGLPHGTKDLFHSLRAMVATWIADAEGVEKAREYLGHSSSSTTMGYLDHSQMKTQRSAVHVLPTFTLPGE